MKKERNFSRTFPTISKRCHVARCIITISFEYTNGVYVDVHRSIEIFDTNGSQSSMDARSILFKWKGGSLPQHYYAQRLHKNLSKWFGSLQHSVSIIFIVVIVLGNYSRHDTKRSTSSFSRQRTILNVLTMTTCYIP